MIFVSFQIIHCEADYDDFYYDEEEHVNICTCSINDGKYDCPCCQTTLRYGQDQYSVCGSDPKPLWHLTAMVSILYINQEGKGCLLC